MVVLYILKQFILYYIYHLTYYCMIIYQFVSTSKLEYLELYNFNSFKE